jgi:ribonuclease D
LAQALAAWRERRADERNRPRGWILDDVSLREITVRLPRSLEALSALPEMQESVVRKCGEELLALVADAGIGDPPPALPRRERPDPAQVALVKRLADIAGEAAKSLEISSEVVATRRELEKLAAGRRDISLLRGWRKEIVGDRLLAAL